MRALADTLVDGLAGPALPQRRPPRFRFGPLWAWAASVWTPWCPPVCHRLPAWALRAALASALWLPAPRRPESARELRAALASAPLRPAPCNSWPAQVRAAESASARRRLVPCGPTPAQARASWGRHSWRTNFPPEACQCAAEALAVARHLAEPCRHRQLLVPILKFLPPAAAASVAVAASHRPFQPRERWFPPRRRSGSPVAPAFAWRGPPLGAASWQRATGREARVPAGGIRPLAPTLLSPALHSQSSKPANRAPKPACPATRRGNGCGMDGGSGSSSPSPPSRQGPRTLANSRASSARPLRANPRGRRPRPRPSLL
mmetsp:Transcript_22170/g.62148  ORF Transcript_22170/g.62148 Transcript_22170/m.62148 type:complete len:319 (+) Transcript_22170:830-1786(+)